MDSFRKILNRFLDVREGELGRLLLMSSYLLMIITCYAITKPVRDSLFLKKIGAEQLPYVYILIALVVGVISSGYSRLASRVSLQTLIRTTSLLIISNLFLFWLALHSATAWMIYVLYIWVSVYGVITASQFWLLANYVFNPREAKRLFAFIGAGGVLGSIFGGAFTRFGATRFGTENLLLWCMGFMFLTIVILERVSKEIVINPSRTGRGEPSPGGSETRRLLKLIWSSRHLTILTAILGITVIIESFVDYQLKFLSNTSFGSQDQLTSFFGTLFASLGAFSLLFQIFLTPRILKRFGVGASILFLPVGLFAGSLVLAFAPSLLAVGFLKVSDGSFRYSIHRSGIELLYLPVPMSIKNQVKGFIDMFIDRLGRGLGGVLLIFCSQVVILSISQLSLLVCGMIGLWIYLSLTIRQEYLNTFRLALEKKTIEPETLRISITDSATLKPILGVLESPDERHVLYAMSLLEDVDTSLWSDQLQPLIRHASPKVRALALERLAADPRPDIAAAVRQCLEDPNLAVRTEAVGYLCLLGGGQPEERVKEFLADQDYAIVSAAVQAVSKYNWNPEGLIDQNFIERALRQEGPQREVARIAAASALGLASDLSPLQSFLAVLLEDESLEVVRTTIRSCGQIRSREALPALVRKLADRRLRSEVREALLRYGSRIVGTLCDYLNDPQESLQVRTNIPKVLSSINSQESVDGLVQALRRLSPFLGYRVIKALNKMRVQFPGLSFKDQAIDLFVLEELKDYYEFFIMLRSEDLNESRSQTALRLLRKSLQERMDQKLERVFRLLGLRYPPNDIYSAYNGWRSQQSHIRASAIEFLDNLLLPDLKQLLFPILEESAIDTLLARGNQRFGLERKTRVAYLDQLIHGRDEWLQTISLYVVGSLGLVELLETVRSAESSQSESVRETARHSLRILEGSEAIV